MTEKQYAKRLRILLIGERFFSNIYRYAGMDNIMKLPPLKRLKFWSGLIKILCVGYLVSVFVNDEIVIILLIVMNIVVAWWCYRWKVYLTSLTRKKD